MKRTKDAMNVHRVRLAASVMHYKWVILHNI